MAAVFDQLTEEERAAASDEESDVRPGKMGFICGRDSKVIFRLDMWSERWKACVEKGLMSRGSLLARSMRGISNRTNRLGTSSKI